MKEWEYKKIALNEAPRRGDEIDLLCDAGEEGWELVAVLPNGVAYMKREVERAAYQLVERPTGTAGHSCFISASSRDGWDRRKVDCAETKQSTYL